jgi:hypothetical protein
VFWELADGLRSIRGGLIVLGYLMSDWNPRIELTAGYFLLGSAGLGLAIRAAQR